MQAEEIPQIKITNKKRVYVLKNSIAQKLLRAGAALECYYHNDVGSKIINVGDVIYSAGKTSTRRFIILAHLGCALKTGVVLPKEVEPFLPRDSL